MVDYKGLYTELYNGMFWLLESSLNKVESQRLQNVENGTSEEQFKDILDRSTEPSEPVEYKTKKIKNDPIKFD